MTGHEFPTVKVKTLLRIVRRYCGDPIRVTGSHHIFAREDGKRVLVAISTKEFPGMWVRALLCGQVGLTPAEALKEVGSR